MPRVMLAYSTIQILPEKFPPPLLHVIGRRCRVHVYWFRVQALGFSWACDSAPSQRAPAKLSWSAAHFSVFHTVFHSTSHLQVRPRRLPWVYHVLPAASRWRASGKRAHAAVVAIGTYNLVYSSRLARCISVSLSRCLTVSLPRCLAVSLFRCLSVSLCVSLDVSFSL